MRFRIFLIAACFFFLSGFILHGTGGGISSGMVVSSTSFYNAAGTTSPGSVTPIQSGLWVNQASIPSGMIAVPSIGGTPLTQWQVDSFATPWSDGSVRGGSFSAIIPTTVASHAAPQVVWTLASGSWPNTSSGTIGNVTSETDFKLVLSGVTNSWVTNYQAGMPFGTVMAPVITPGGAMTSIHMRQAPTFGFTCTAPGFGTNFGCVPPTTTATASSTGATITVANKLGAVSGNASQIGIYDVTTSTDLGQISPSSAGGSGPGTLTLTAPATVNNGDTLQFFYSVSGCGTGANVPLFSLTTASNLPTGGTVKAGGNCPGLGSGAWTFDINSIIAGAGAPISCDQATTNSQVCQYAKGNVKDGFRIYGDFIDNAAVAWAVSTPYTSGTQVKANGNIYTETVASCTSAGSGTGPTGRAGPSGLITGIVDNSCLWNVVPQPLEGEAWVERWKNSGGTTLAYQILFEVIPNHYSPGGATTSYTFTADLMDGATEIHGSAGGDANWQGIVTPSDTGRFLTVDTTYQPFWYQTSGGTGNDAGWNNVVVSLATGDKVYWKSAHVFAPPSDKFTLTQSTLSIDTSGNMAKGICNYVPYADCDLDSVGVIGAGGNHAWDGPLSLANISHYMSESALAGSGGDGGRTWLQNSDAGAVNELGYQGGLNEPATFHPVNLLPTATSPGWTKPASFVDPVRQSAWLFYSGSSDMNVGPGMWPWFGGTPGFDVEHNPQELEYPYIMQGYRFLLDGMGDLANMVGLTYSPARRTTTFGGTTYNGALGQVYIIRSNAWLMNQEQDAAVFLPTASDVGQYFQYIVKNTYDAEAAMYPFTGTVCVGVGSVQCGPKNASLTTNGHWLGAQNLFSGVGLPGTWFMDGYMGFVVSKAKMFYAGAVPSIDTDAGYFLGNYLIANAALNCSYNTTPYVFPYSGLDGSAAPYYSGPSNSNVASPQSPVVYPLNANLLNSIAGDSVFSAAYSSQDVGLIGASEKHSTATANASGTNLQIANVGTINFGAQVYDLTTPTAIPAHTYVAVSGTTSLTLSATTTVANGDSIGFSHMLNYPDTYTSPVLPSGTLFTPLNMSTQLEEAPSPYTVGVAPPGGFSYGSWYVWTATDASGTSGTLSPFGGGAPIVPTTSGAMNWGFIPNTTCPPPTAGEINDGAADYQANQNRLAEEFAVANFWAAIVGNTGQPAQAITNLTPSQTPLSIYNVLDGPKWLYDSTFSYNP